MSEEIPVIEEEPPKNSRSIFNGNDKSGYKPLEKAHVILNFVTRSKSRIQVNHETFNNSQKVNNSSLQSIEEYKSVRKTKAVSSIATQSKHGSQEKQEISSSSQNTGKTKLVESAEALSVSSFSNFSYNEGAVVSAHTFKVLKKKMKKGVSNEITLFLIIVLTTMLCGTVVLRRGRTCK